MSHRSPLALFLSSFGLVALAACGAAPEEPQAARPIAKASAAQAKAIAPGHVARADVERVLRVGPSWVFRRVLNEPIVREDGALVGWRIIGLPENWSAIDLKPGDIVTRVNGVAIVKPDDAWTAWKATASARELRIDISRDGQVRTVVVPIDGDPSPDVVAALSSDQPPPRNPNQPKGTVVIEDDPSLGE